MANCKIGFPSGLQLVAPGEFGALSKRGSHPSIAQSCAASHNSSVWAGELHLPLQSPALLIRLTPVIAPSSLPFLRTAHGRRRSGRG